MGYNDPTRGNATMSPDPGGPDPGPDAPPETDNGDGDDGGERRVGSDDGHGKIEYEPHANPDAVVDTRKVYVYPPKDGIVPDVIITQSEGDEHFRLWGYQGAKGMLVLVVHTDHKHPPLYPAPECRKWTLSADQWPSLESAPETPAEISKLAMLYSDAPVADQSEREDLDASED